MQPGLAAMEIATLVGMFPGRLSVAFGPGVEAWMVQIGARPAADRVVALEETVSAVQSLLGGQTVTM